MVTHATAATAATAAATNGEQETGGATRGQQGKAATTGYLQVNINNDNKHNNGVKAAMKVNNVQRDANGYFQCPVCEKLFTVKGSMLRHMDTVHNPEQPRWTCTECGKTTGTRDSLQRHIRRVHKRIFKHHCTFCGRGFHTQVDLKGHLAHHTHRKEFVCGECGHQFSHMKSLKVHRLTLNHDVRCITTLVCSLMRIISREIK